MTFDPETFLDATFTEANATQYEPIPAGEYVAMIEDIKFTNGTDKNGKPWTRLDLTWSLEDEALKETLGRKRLIGRQGILLEMFDSGGLASGRGKNVQLGQLREAVDLNRPGEIFTCRMLQGRRAKVKISHRTYEGKLFEEIKGVARLA